MSLSLGEAAALAVKAVRGAGQPWGVAEEAGWAIRWLGRAGLPGVEALARALEAGDLAPLLAGIAIADRAEVPDAVGPLSEPLLAVPFLARLVPAGAALEFSCEGTRVRIWARGCDPVPGGGTLRAAAQAPLPDPLPPAHLRIEADAAAVAVLERFAALTYAPATEASRLRGAGAGLIDND